MFIQKAHISLKYIYIYEYTSGFNKLDKLDVWSASTKSEAFLYKMNHCYVVLLHNEILKPIITPNYLTLHHLEIWSRNIHSQLYQC